MFGILKFFVALNGNGKPMEIAAGIAYGFWLALLPMDNVLWIVLLVLSGFFRINQGAVILGAFLLKLCVGPFTPLLDNFGWLVLSRDSLYGFFTVLKNAPIVPWTKFDNSVVMGAFLLGPFLSIPVLFSSYFLVRVYRKQLRDRFLRSKFIRILGKFPIVNTLIDKYRKAAEIISIVR
ncbi:TIGR03546 family protein [Candidatus Haliotispira prima]|uniref:TIGR03546 family protein n=1 Tax=Candidatus Haliotispira prima TaxID=3034016 RepID=A0ABY8MDS2_9SPIO|nr:TIGR03546 family protein [Candidatus Haliotispira prima]